MNEGNTTDMRFKKEDIEHPYGITGAPLSAFRDRMYEVRKYIVRGFSTKAGTINMTIKGNPCYLPTATPPSSSPVS